MRASRWLLAHLLGFVFAALAAMDASAQSQGLVVRDGTLGKGELAVGPGVDPLGRPATYLIIHEMGEQHEGNLFHSFASFGIGAGEVATFTGPESVSNVIARVTGGDPSQIDGTLRSTIPDADLWLLNPSGVVFGAGAQLDVSGSFHASTGDYVGFGTDGLERFQADPSRPSVLSTAAPTAFGFLNESAAASLEVDGARLAVPDGETLELVAADGVSLTGADLVAPNGHVSLEAQGAVELSDSSVDVGGDAPGSVSIRAGRVVVEHGSHVISENSGTAEDAGGSIAIAAIESVLVDDSLLSVSTHSAGNAGTIRVEGPEVTFQNGPGFIHDFVDPIDPRNQPHPTEAGASAETSGRGAGGTIQIDAESLAIQQGVSLSAETHGLAATGDGGTIRIHADSMDLLDRSLVSASAFGSQGDAGTVQLDVRGELRVDGNRIEGSPREAGQADFAMIGAWVVLNLAAPPGTRLPGAPGTIDIEAGSVEIANGYIGIECSGCTSKAATRPADAAMVRIEAERIVIGGAGDAQVNAGTWGNGDGDGGSIRVQADSLTIEGGGAITAATSGAGNAGTITVNADSVLIGRSRDAPPGVGGRVTASSSGRGAAGTIDIAATDSIFLTHEGGGRFSLLAVVQGGLDFSGVFSATVGGGSAGGSIRLAAPEITVTDGAIIATSTIGGGKGGTIEVVGNRIVIANGGVVDTTSFPIPFSPFVPGGDAGSVTLEASERIEVVGRHPEFGDLSRVSSSSMGSGKAGEVVLHAPRIVIDEGAVATTAVAFLTGQEGSAGGSITIRAGELVVANGGQVNASTFIAGQAGGIDVVAQESILVTGDGSGIESRTGSAGAGGDVSLTAPTIGIDDGGEVSARSEHGVGSLADFLASTLDFRLIRLPPVNAAPTGDAGTVSLDAQREVRLDRGTIATNAEAANGGDVAIRANELLSLDRSVITASVTGGMGGNITIDPEFVILQNGSRIEASAGAGAGGQIQITTGNFLAFPDSMISATAGNPELSGTVEIHSPDVNLAGTLTPLASSFLDAASLMRERCAERRSGERVGSFSVRGAGGIPAEPDGWLRAPVIPEVGAGVSGSGAQTALLASLPSALLMDGGCP